MNAGWKVQNIPSSCTPFCGILFLFLNWLCSCLILLLCNLELTVESKCNYNPEEDGQLHEHNVKDQAEKRSLNDKLQRIDTMPLDS